MINQGGRDNEINSIHQFPATVKIKRKWPVMFLFLPFKPDTHTCTRKIARVSVFVHQCGNSSFHNSYQISEPLGNP